VREKENSSIMFLKEGNLRDVRLFTLADTMDQGCYAPCICLFFVYMAKAAIESSDLLQVFWTYILYATVIPNTVE
jgi:hypothetical protein